MGKAKDADGSVDSDYSGRPTPEEIASSTSSVPPEDRIETTLPDGRLVVQGYDEENDSVGWYLPDDEGWPDYDRPVTVDEMEP